MTSPPHEVSSSSGGVHIRALPEQYSSASQDAAAQSAAPQVNEQRRTLFLTAYLFAASCVFVLGRTARDAFFLSHYGAQANVLLPWMFVAYGLTSGLVAIGYSRLASSTRRHVFVMTSSLLFAGFFGLIRVLVPLRVPGLYSVLYVATEVIANLTFAQFWSVANDMHDARSARRLFGVIGTGRTLGMLVCGLGVGSFVSEIGTENLLVVIAVLYLVIAGTVWFLHHEYKFDRALHHGSTSRGSTWAVLQIPVVRRLAVLMLFAFVAVNVGDFQFKAVARLMHPNRESLAHFMALFYATLGAIALVIQLVGTRLILTRFGVFGGMLAMPIAYLGTNIALLAVPGLTSATAVKLSDNALQFTLFEATLQLLYFPLRTQEKVSARSLVDVIARPIGYSLAGLVVLGLRAWHMPSSVEAIASQSWFVIPIVLGWLWLVPGLRDRYVVALERAISRGETDTRLAIAEDASAHRVLVKMLQSNADRSVVFALEQLKSTDPALTRLRIPALLVHSSPRVRLAALRTATDLQATETLLAVRQLIRDSDARVAALAVETVGLLTGEDCLPDVADRVEDARPEVQDAAVGTLLCHGGFDGLLVAARKVETWLNSTEPQDRIRAARVFARRGIPGPRRVVQRLLSDEDPDVRLAAVQAASKTADVRLASLLLQSMSDRNAVRAAASGLANMGEAVVPIVVQAFDSAQTPRNVALELPRILARVGTPEAWRALCERIDIADPWLRQKVLASASRARLLGRYPPLPTARVEARMADEIAALHTQRVNYETVRMSIAIPMLDRWWIEQLRRGMVRALRLAELVHPRQRVAAARDVLFGNDVARRVQGIELLENLFSVQLRQAFVRELDAWHALRTTPLVPGPTVTASTRVFLESLGHSPEPFERVLALDAAQFRRVPIETAQVMALTRDADACVRELAALVLATFQPKGWRDEIDRMQRDEDPHVSAYAAYVFTTGQTGMDPNDDFYTTLEKVLFLQRIELFADVPPEHLLALARATQVEHRTVGEQIFAQGDPGEALYFVIDGSVQIDRPDGTQTKVGEGEVFGDLAVLDPAPRSASASVVGRATLLRIAQEDFYEVLRDTAELGESVIRVLTRRLRKASPTG